MANILTELRRRGCVMQCTDNAALEQYFGGEAVFYLGIDPSGDSLHVGHLLPLILSVHLARAGHRAIMLIGGGTSRIGDPSGKTEMRRLIDKDTIQSNAEKISGQIQTLFSTCSVEATFVNNADWLNGLKYIDFLRDIGRHFSVNRMLGFETYRQRLQGNGLSFIEFNYQLLQSYDFLTLFQQEGCRLQIGGDDQWGNIVSGIDLIHRVCRGTSYGLTCPLVTTADGAKMGKTEKGAIFLDPVRCSPFNFFQYWRNVDDKDVERFLNLYTLLSIDEIHALCREKGMGLNAAKERLAWEMTKLIHGETKAEQVRNSARSLFSGDKTLTASMPSYSVPEDLLLAGIALPELFVLAGLSRSKSEARRIMRQGGVQVNGKRVYDESTIIGNKDMQEGRIVLRAGKKSYCAVVLI